MAYLRIGIKRFVANNSNTAKNKKIKKYINSINGFCLDINEFKLLQKINIKN